MALETLKVQQKVWALVTRMALVTWKALETVLQTRMALEILWGSLTARRWVLCSALLTRMALEILWGSLTDHCWALCLALLTRMALVTRMALLTVLQTRMALEIPRG